MAHKYHAKPCRIKGMFFASKKEADRWLILQDEEKRGKISGLLRQMSYPLIMETTYRADFVYRKGNEIIVEDVKGYRTREYLRKKKLMREQHNIEIKEV